LECESPAFAFLFAPKSSSYIIPRHDIVFGVDLEISNSKQKSFLPDFLKSMDLHQQMLQSGAAFR